MGVRSQRGIDWEAAKQDSRMASLWRFLVASCLTTRYLWYDIQYKKNTDDSLRMLFGECGENDERVLMP